MLAFESPSLNQIQYKSLISTGQINVEERSVETVHDNLLLVGLRAVCLAVLDGLIDVARSFTALAVDLSALRAANLKVAVLLVLSVFSNTEDRLPALVFFTLFSRVAKASSCKSSSSPAVVDMSKVPLNLLWVGVTIELVANIDEVFLESWQIIFNNNSLTTTRARVIPGTVSRSVVWVGVSAASLLEDRRYHVVQVVVGVGVVVSLREPVDEDSGEDIAICLLVVIVAGRPVLETAASFDDTEEEERDRHADGGVDAVLNRREDGDEDTSEEDENLDRRNSPELVHSVGRGNEITDSMNNNS
ncbi:sulfate permease, partial [Aureobasidium melanogenum]